MLHALRTRHRRHRLGSGPAPALSRVWARRLLWLWCLAWGMAAAAPALNPPMLQAVCGQGGQARWVQPGAADAAHPDGAAGDCAVCAACVLQWAATPPRATPFPAVATTGDCGLPSARTAWQPEAPSPWHQRGPP